MPLWSRLEVSYDLALELAGFGAGLSKYVQHGGHGSVLADTYRVSLPAPPAPRRPHAADALPAAREAHNRLARFARSQALGYQAVLYW